MKKDITQLFKDEIYTTPPRKYYPTYKIVYNHFDEISSFDLLDINDYKTSNNRGYRYILVVIDKFSKYGWTVPLKKKMRYYQMKIQKFYLFQKQNLIK